MRNFYPLAAMAAGSAVLLSGCIDNNYDLSDIDTTTQISFNNLTLPIQIDPVLLSDVIEVKEGDKIQEVTINGETFYAVQQEGDFHSDPVRINSFSAEPSVMTPSHAEFQSTAAAARNNKRAASISRTYSLKERVFKDFHYISDDVDEAIHDITALDFQPLDLTISLTMTGVDNSIPSRLTDVTLVIPQGLDITGVTAPGYTYKAADYTSVNGELALDQVNLVNGKASISIHAVGIDLDHSRYPEHADVFDYPTHTFDFASQLTLENASLVLSPDDSQAAALPATILFDIDYALNDIDATHMLGAIEYHIDGDDLEIDPVNLTDLPDFLAGDETNLILYNPQIYLSLNNPVAPQGLNYTSGLDIKSIRDSHVDGNYPLNAFTVPADMGSGPYHFVLAPEPDKVDNIPADYAPGIRGVVYPGLGNILSGPGLPAQLDLELVDPMIPLQTMTSKIELGVDLEEMSGHYLFLAPLALEGTADSGSLIVYTDRSDGWNDEDVEAMTINHMSIKAVASSNLPYNVELSIYPINAEGRRIDADITPVTLPANAVDTDIECIVEGTIKSLDGLEYVARVRANGEDSPLAPDQSISLDNIKIKVTGNYTKEL